VSEKNEILFYNKKSNMSLNNNSKKYFTDMVLKQLIIQEQFNGFEREYQTNYYNKHKSCYKDDIILFVIMMTQGKILVMF